MSMSAYVDLVPPKRDKDQEPAQDTSYALPIMVALCLLLIIFSDLWNVTKRRRRRLS
jgi:hypothetical protein